MSDRQAFDRQLEREVDHLAGPKPYVDVTAIVANASRPSSASRFTRLFGSVPLAAAAAVGVLIILVVLVALPADPDGDGALVPGATPVASPSVAPEATPAAVTGTWTRPDDETCVEGEERPIEDDPDFVLSAIECSGFSMTADDPRLMAAGGTRLEIAEDGPDDPPSIWWLENDGGRWESVRFQEHERYVFVGSRGYERMTAVLSLRDDGTLDGFIRERPAENPAAGDNTDPEAAP